MSGDETRRLLKTFGIAVTRFEEAVRDQAAPEELQAAEAEVRSRLEEITALVDRLRHEGTRAAPAQGGGRPAGGGGIQ